MKKLRTAKLLNWRELAPRNVVDALDWYADHNAKQAALVINVGATDPNVWIRLSEALDFIGRVVNAHVTLSDMDCLLRAVLGGSDPLKAWCAWEYTQRQE